MRLQDFWFAQGGTGMQAPAAQTCWSWEEIEQLVIARMPDPTPHQPHVWVNDLIRRVNWSEFGVHLNGGQRSTDAVALRGMGVDQHDRRLGFQSADVIRGAKTDHPEKTLQLVTEYRDDATFGQVINRPRTALSVGSADLGRLAVSGTGWTLKGQPWAWIGVSGFDLPVRVHWGDPRFLDWAAATGFTIVRVVTFTNYRMPRTPTDGLSMLPRTLQAAADRGLCVEIVALADTQLIGMTEAEVRRVVEEIGAMAWGHQNVAVELWNEVTHHTQLDRAQDIDWQAELRSLIPALVPVSMGSSHGGEPILWTGGDYITHHADRGRSAVANASTMAAAQANFAVPVIDDEPQGAHEYAVGSSRYGDPEEAMRQGRALRAGQLGGTFHFQAGLSASAALLADWPVQQEAARRYVAARRGAS